MNIALPIFVYRIKFKYSATSLNGQTFLSQSVLRYLSRSTDKITQEELKQIVKETFSEGEPIMATIAEEMHPG